MKTKRSQWLWLVILAIVGIGVTAAAQFGTNRGHAPRRAARAPKRPGSSMLAPQFSSLYSSQSRRGPKRPTE